jgi:Ca-activated chloride channel family protein
VFLSVLGFGSSNYQDSKMELLADKGNGNYVYIDQLAKAKQVLVQQFGGTLFELAKDVKVQVEFNSALVREYCLLAAEDFDDDHKDAGELGASQQITALYEVIPVGAPAAADSSSIDPLKCQTTKALHPGSPKLLTMKLCYQVLQGSASCLLELPVDNRICGGTSFGKPAFRSCRGSVRDVIA